MSVPLVQENDIPELDLPGRHLRWLVNRDRLNAAHLSACMIRVAPGENRPAGTFPPQRRRTDLHHPGHGRVMVDGEVEAVKEGSVVLYPQGSVHMLQNNGSEEMKAICFFAPASDLATYRFFEDVEFPGMTNNPVLDFEIDKSAIQYAGEDLKRPECILAEPDGTLWAADARGGVARINPDGTQEIITQKRSGQFRGRGERSHPLPGGNAAQRPRLRRATATF